MIARILRTAARLLLLLGVGLLPVQSAAIGPLYVVCRGLAGCGLPPGNALVSAALTTFSVLITIAAGSAVIFVVYNGFQMVISYGDDSKITEARWGVLYALAGLGIALVSASMVQFVGTQNYVQGSGDLIIGFMTAVVNIMITLFNVLFALAVVIAGIRMVTASGNSEEFKKGFNMIKTAVIGAVIINAGRALVNAFLSLNL